MRILGYTYEADYHCISCADADGMTADNAVDREGNEPGVIFETDETDPLGVYCGDCGAEIAEGCWRYYDGAGDWPDWAGVTHCLCGRELTEDVLPDHCPDCGAEPWQLLAENCEGCGKPVYPWGRYYLSDWGDLRHVECRPYL